MITVQIKKPKSLSALIEPKKSFNASLSVSVKESVVVKSETYEGEYSVTPSTTEQTLNTKNKLMREDLVINEIPFYRVSNPTGGKTVYIANNIDEVY